MYLFSNVTLTTAKKKKTKQKTKTKKKNKQTKQKNKQTNKQKKQKNKKTKKKKTIFDYSIIRNIKTTCTMKIKLSKLSLL